jgi:hypothetical protein
VKTLANKIEALAGRVAAAETIHVAIFGLGSVGHYLLEYLVALRDPRIKLYVVGRDRGKLLRDVNLSKVAGLIRGRIPSEIEIIEADFDSVSSLRTAIARTRADFIINTSRVFPGPEYGSFSWKTVRAYGLWAPIAVKYVRNLMAAYAAANSSAIVINASYPDVTNAWLKSAGLAHPDFGSGTLNHLVPRVRLAVAAALGFDDPEVLDEIDVTMATSHFHAAAIGREGVTDGVEPLLYVEHHGREVGLKAEDIYRRCALALPTDEKRNMMNASSNLEIITKLLQAVRTQEFQKLHVPGLDGWVGGYPFFVRPGDPSSSAFECGILEEPFPLAEMIEHNRRSIYLDGIAGVREGVVHYTPELVQKVKQAFGFDLPGEVSLDASDEVAAALFECILSKPVAVA